MVDLGIHAEDYITSCVFFYLLYTEHQNVVSTGKGKIKDRKIWTFWLVYRTSKAYLWVRVAWCKCWV